MPEDNLIKKIINEFALVFKPLHDAALAEPPGSGVVAFVRELGWDLGRHISSADISSFTSTIKTIFSSLEASTRNGNDILLILENVSSFTKMIANIQNFNTNGLGTQELRDAFSELGLNIIDFLIVKYLQRKAPVLHNILVLFGIIRVSYIKGTPPVVEHTSWKIQWNAIEKIFSDPQQLLISTYGWSRNDFDPQKLLTYLRNLLLLLDVPAHFQLQDQGETPAPDTTTALRVPLFWQQDGENLFEVGGSIVPLKTADEQYYESLAIVPYGKSGFGQKINICGSWFLKLLLQSSFEGNWGLIIHPQNGLSLENLDDANEAGLNLGFGVELNREDESGSMILFGEEDGSHLKASSTGIKLFYSIEQNDGNEFVVEGALRNAEIVIKAGDGDGFLGKILPPEGIRVHFDVIAGWSSIEGLYFKGSASLEITIPIHKNIGPISFESIYISLALREDGNIRVRAAVCFGGCLGPLSFSIRRIGIESLIKIDRSPSFNLSFLPPLGAGLAIDAGTVTGGGYLEFDNDNKRYAGILELAFGKIGLTAVGLITTRMPDGSKGFSMLVVIGVEFDPPITLPYNFNLSGVGGLLGIQRSMNVDYLREGLKQGTLDSVLFPQDPIANAARIISDLRAGFPPDKGRYLFGPMAIIGWGNPKIIRAEVGIFIELPKPVRVAILGQVTAQLPNAEADTETVVVIHLDILGVLDFEKKTFSLDAVIYDSRILQFSLSGDMAMRFSWGSPPFFLISFGGYNPKFKVQAGMPALRRMTLSLGKGSNPRLSLECYMAVTTNSLQFGAKLELLAKKSKFKVHGYLYFHALFIFSPFSFVIDMGAGVEVFAGGASLLSITLDFTLSGPTPWRAKGTGKFKILCVKVKIRFDVTWGRRGGRALPAMDPWEDLLAALNSPGNWKSLLPGESEQLVRLRKIEDAAGTVNVHSRGLSQISQTVLPFNEKLDKYGNHPIAGDTEYRVTEINDLPVEDANALRVAYTKEYYATGQSKKLSHSEKLSRPSFEEYDMNIVIGSERVTAGPARHCALAFETEVIDENRVASPLPRTGLPWRNAAAGLANRAGKNRGRDKYFNAAQKPLVGVLTERYHVTDKYSGRSVAAAADTFGGAKSVLEQYAHDNPETAGNVQIVTGYERMS